MNFQFNSSFIRFGLGKVNTDIYTEPMQSGEVNHNLNFLNTNSEVNDYVSFSDNEGEIYKTTPEVQIVIKKGSELFSNGKWVLKSLKNNAIIEKHGTLDLMNNPNVLQSGTEFLRDLYIKRAIYGNAMSYLNFALETSPLPASIINLDSFAVSILRTGKLTNQIDVNEIIKEYRLNTYGNKFEKFKPKEIVHLKITNPNDIVMGLSPLSSLMMPISNIRAGRGYIYADYVKKGAHGAFSPEQKNDTNGMLPILSKDVLKAEKDYAEKTHGSGQNKSSVLFLKTPMKWWSISSEIKNHMIHEEIEMSFKRIIDAYNLNDGLFSSLKKSTFSNQENGEKQAYQNHIIPLGKDVANSFNDKLKLKEKGLFLELDYSNVSVLKSDELKKSNTLKVKIENYSKLIELGYNKEEAKSVSGLN